MKLLLNEVDFCTRAFPFALIPKVSVLDTHLLSQWQKWNWRIFSISKKVFFLVFKTQQIEHIAVTCMSCYTKMKSKLRTFLILAWKLFFERYHSSERLVAVNSFQSIAVFIQAKFKKYSVLCAQDPMLTIITSECVQGTLTAWNVVACHNKATWTLHGETVHAPKVPQETLWQDPSAYRLQLCEVKIYGRGTES